MPLPSPIEDLFLKIRKGTTASLNAARWKDVFAHLDGWRMEQVTVTDFSDSEVILKDVLGQVEGARSLDLQHLQAGKRPKPADPLIALEVRQMVGDSAVCRSDRTSEREARQMLILRGLIERLQMGAEATSTNAWEGKGATRWRIHDLQIADFIDGHEDHVLRAEFAMEISGKGWRITAPDGQTYTVFGSYKNGALNPRSFQDFAAWAAEETSLVTQVCDRLGMDPLPPKEDETRYVPPPGAPAAVTQAWEALKEITAGLYAELRDQVAAHLEGQVAAWETAVAKGDRERMRAIAKGPAGLVLSRHAVRTAPGTLDGRQGETIARMAEDTADAMRDGFVARNARKVAPILTAKPNLTGVTTLRLDVADRMIVGRLLYRFDDTSSFEVETSAVMAWAPVRQYPFYRFPVTFKDVWCTDGRIMAAASEQEMNEIYAVAAAPEGADARGSPEPSPSCEMPGL